MSYRIGADIGGTFTDVVLNGPNGAAWSAKVLTTVDDFSRGIAEASMDLLRSAGVHPEQVTEVVHGTTVATNAILEDKGAKTALVTTEGFRDVLELRRLRVPELFSLSYRPPKPLVPRRRRIEVRERVDFSGSVVTPLDEESLSKAIDQITEERPEAVAVCLLHPYANPDHERAIGRRIAECLPDAFVTLSVDVLPEIREYERTSSTVINAYVGPVVSRYVESLQRRLAGSGISAPLRVMRSDGGVLTAAATGRVPAQIIESGPAAGVIATADLANRTGRPDMIAFDMGGTTAKAALIERGRPAWTTEYEVGAGMTLSNRLVKGSGHALRLPVIDLAEVGAGGGSIVSVDGGGAMKVGPESAGASPGPACYGAGGTDPTVTDANVVLGYLNPAQLAGGGLMLDRAAAWSAIGSVSTATDDEALLRTAFGVHEISNATMVRAIKAVTTYQGRDPRNFSLLAFGGSGPVHAAHVAKLLGITAVVVPPSPGVFSAVGLLQAAPEFHTTRTCLLRAKSDDISTLRHVFAELRRQAEAQLQSDGFGDAAVAWTQMVDARFVGQSSELPIEVGEPLDWEHIADTFVDEHRSTYGHANPNSEVQVVNARVRAVVGGGQDVPRVTAAAGKVTAETTSRDAYFGASAGMVKTPVVRREQVPATGMDGPVIVDEMDATAVVPPDCRVWLDPSGSLVIGIGGGR